MTPSLGKPEIVPEAAVVPIDLFKWIASLAIGLIIFSGALYNRTFFGVFGVQELNKGGEVVRIVVDAFSLIVRPSFIASCAAISVIGYFALRQFPRTKNIVLGILIPALFLSAGLVAQYEAKKDARQLLYGELGRKAWCALKPNVLDPAMAAAFLKETQDNRFRLVFQSGEYIVLANHKMGQRLAKDAKGQAIMVRQSDVSVCRFSGESLWMGG